MGKKRCLVLPFSAVLLLVLGACSKVPDATVEEETATSSGAAVEARPAPAESVTGSDYHSTSLRARRRGLDRLEGVNSERSEQIEDEKSFGQSK